MALKAIREMETNALAVFSGRSNDKNSVVSACPRAQIAPPTRKAITQLRSTFDFGETVSAICWYSVLVTLMSKSAHILFVLFTSYFGLLARFYTAFPVGVGFHGPKGMRWFGGGSESCLNDPVAFILHINKHAPLSAFHRKRRVYSLIYLQQVLAAVLIIGMDGLSHPRTNNQRVHLLKGKFAGEGPPFVHAPAPAKHAGHGKNRYGMAGARRNGPAAPFADKGHGFLVCRIESSKPSPFSCYIHNTTLKVKYQA